MKATSTILSVAFALAASFLAAEAQAKGGHVGGHSSSGNRSMNVSQSHSNGSMNKTSLHTTNLTQGHKPNTGGQKLGNKNFTKTSFEKGGKGSKKGWPGKNWWNCGGFCCGGFCWGGWWYDGCDDCDCCEPWYYNPCYNVCGDYYTSDFAVAAAPARIVRIANPAETQSTLGFAIDGQPYSLEAGKVQNVELSDTAVIEFDRGSGDDTGRYTLSPGEYQFGATPKGWELFRAGDESETESVAAN